MNENLFRTLSQSIFTYVDALSYDKNYHAIIESIIQVFPGPASIKNNTTLSYVAVNKHAMKNYGFYLPSDMIGKTLRDVSKKVTKSWPKNYSDTITEYETMVLDKKTPIISFDEFPYINAENELRMYCINKIPLLNHTKKSIGLLTLAFDTMSYRDKDFLRQTYQKIYANKKVALEKFLIQIGLEKYIGITNRELDCVILRSRGKSLKEIGVELTLSSRTVEAYINQVRDKFSCSTNAVMMDEFFYHYHQLYSK